MKLLILSANVSNYNTVRVAQEAQNIFEQVSVSYYHDLFFKFEKGKVLIQAGNFYLNEFTHLLFRGTGKGEMNLSTFRDALVTYYDNDSTFIYNKNMFSVLNGRFNKLLQQLILSKNNIPVVDSLVMGGIKQVAQHQHDLPIILKPLEGSHGGGIVRVNQDHELFYQIGVALPWRMMVQEFQQAKYDIRIFVVNQTIVAAMKRAARANDEFNTLKQDKSKRYLPLQPSEDLRDLALKTAQVFNADYCGIDIMENNQGKFCVLEVNPMPEFEILEEVTGINIAKAIVKAYE